jgi:predicted glutamine amidotransferase
MCRLFALSGGREPLRATFWLLDAPDALVRQSRRNPDGYGLATFEPDGSPDVDKRPAAAHRDTLFAREAREEASTTFVAHVRFASQGLKTLENTHPFEQHGRVFAHNGHFDGLDTLESHLGPHLGLVQGDTDSERLFALVTREIDVRGLDPGDALAEAARWIARELPVFALNCVLATPTDLWALRYPETHDLYMLERATGGPGGDAALDAASAARRIRMRSQALADRAGVVFASEQMDDDPGWRLLEPGELVHVDGDLNVSSRIELGDPPAHPIRPDDLDPRTAAAAMAAEPELARRYAPTPATD